MSRREPTNSDVLIAAIAELSELKAELVMKHMPVPLGIEAQLKQLAIRLSQGGQR